MHLTSPGGSQSPEGQTEAETYERGDLRIASSRSGPAEPLAEPHGYPLTPLSKLPRWSTAAAALPGTARVREPAGGCTFITTQGSNSLATEIGIRELLEAGVHFGHQTRRWN